MIESFFLKAQKPFSCVLLSWVTRSGLISITAACAVLSHHMGTSSSVSSQTTLHSLLPLSSLLVYTHNPADPLDTTPAHWWPLAVQVIQLVFQVICFYSYRKGSVSRWFSAAALLLYAVTGFTTLHTKPAGKKTVRHDKQEISTINRHKYPYLEFLITGGGLLKSILSQSYPPACICFSHIDLNLIKLPPIFMYNYNKKQHDMNRFPRFASYAVICQRCHNSFLNGAHAVGSMCVILILWHRKLLAIRL